MYAQIMTSVFDACVRLLETAAFAFGMTYKEINVWIFCILWPLATVGLVAVAVRQARVIRRMRGPVTRFVELDARRL